MSKSNHSYELVYLDMRGRGELIRLLFQYFKVKFEDKRVSRDEWMELKDSSPMMQMPYLEIDGRHTLCQTASICRYIAKSLHPEQYFGGSTKIEAAKCDMIVEGYLEFLSCIGPVLHGSTDAAREMARERFETAGPNFLRSFERILEQNKGEYFLGEKLTFADLVAATVTSVFDADFPGSQEYLKACPHLIEHYHRIRKLPEISDYIESSWPPANV